MNPRRELWDFDENKNYIHILGFKVLNYPDAIKAAYLLQSVKGLIFNCFMSILHNEMITPEVELLVNTPFLLQEMQLEKDQLIIKFDGLNKPKNIHVTNEISIGPDKNLRAQYKLIEDNINKDKMKDVFEKLTLDVQNQNNRFNTDIYDMQNAVSSVQTQNNRFNTDILKNTK